MSKTIRIMGYVINIQKEVKKFSAPAIDQQQRKEAAEQITKSDSYSELRAAAAAARARRMRRA